MADLKNTAANLYIYHSPSSAPWAARQPSSSPAWVPRTGRPSRVSASRQWVFSDRISSLRVRDGPPWARRAAWTGSPCVPFSPPRRNTAFSCRGWQADESILPADIVPVIMAGIIGIYGLVVSVLISDGLKQHDYALFTGFIQLGAGLSVGLAGMAAGFAIGIVGDAGVRGTAQQPRLFVGMILILIFAEVLGRFFFLFFGFPPPPPPPPASRFPDSVVYGRCRFCRTLPELIPPC